MTEDAKREEDPSSSEPVNINIVKKDYNKENVSQLPSGRRPRPPPAVGGGEMTRAAALVAETDVYEKVDA